VKSISAITGRVDGTARNLLARKGVPAIFGVGGPLDDPPAPAELSARLDDYLKNKYHRPSDEVRDDWDMRGITDDVKISRGALSARAIPDHSRTVIPWKIV